MTRTTEEASAIQVLVLGLDGKSKKVYELRPPLAGFYDVANTLDHARNAGLEPLEPVSSKTKQPVKA